MGFIETSYSNSPNLSQVNIDSNLDMDTFGISAGGAVSFSGGLDLNNTDLTGVKRFMCEDYLGAIKATASDNQQDTVSIDNIVTTTNGNHVYSIKLFRIPSNFISGSSIRVKYTAAVSVSKTLTSGLYLYDPDTDTRTEINSHTTPGSTSETVSFDITVNAGELYGLYAYALTSGGNAYGNITLYYDLFVQSGAVWEVITP